MKKAHSEILRRVGINGLIAIKSQIVLHTGGVSNIYKRIKFRMYYKHTIDTIAGDLIADLHHVKDCAQYQ